MKASQLVISVILGLRLKVNQKPRSGRFPLVQVLQTRGCLAGSYCSPLSNKHRLSLYQGCWEAGDAQQREPSALTLTPLNLPQLGAGIPSPGCRGHAAAEENKAEGAALPKSKLI